MKYLIKEDDISILNFSTRTYNCLKRSGINTIGELMEFPQEKLERIRNMGKASIKEISDILTAICSGTHNEFSLVDVREEPKQIHEEKKIEIKDASIESLGLSNSINNRLKSIGIYRISQLQRAKVEDILSIKNIRTTTVNQIFERLDALNENMLKILDAEDALSGINKYVLDIIGEIRDVLLIEENICKREVLSAYTRNPAIDKNDFIEIVYNSKAIRDAVKTRILSILRYNPKGIGKEEIIKYMPEHLRETDVAANILSEMINGKEIVEVDNGSKVRFISCLDFVERIPNERDRFVLAARLNGKSLEEVGQSIGGVTRERVRQITNKMLSKRPELYEDGYLYLYDNYDITKEDFCLATKEAEYVYHYVEIISHVKPADKKSIDMALTDNKLSIEVRKGIEKAIYKDYITVKSERVHKSRPELVEFYVRTKCRNLTSFKDFYIGYRDFLSEYDILIDKYDIEERTYLNHLSGCDYTLWNVNRSFRYYDVHAADSKAFIKSINFKQYRNKELSALKIYKDYPEVMKEYDIRDEYELHNFLKKISDKIKFKIEFGRMPTLIVGKADRDEQVKNLLFSLSPIENTVLAKCYEEEYGVKAGTAMANYFGCISLYYHDGVYTVPTESMPQLNFEQRSKMKEVLYDDFYMIEEVEERFLKIYPKGDRAQINPYSLKKIGFNVYAGYVLKKEHSSMEYFEKLLTTDNIVDARTWNDKMTLPAFTTVMYRLKADFDIVEYLPLQFINIRELNKMGITKDNLRDYLESVMKTVSQSEYFTVKSLQKNGFTHDLYNYDFEDWFYSSIITEGKDVFTCQRVGGTKLFLKEKKAFVFMDMVVQLLATFKKISYIELQKFILDEYGIVTDKDKFLYDIRRSSLYYDSIEKVVYYDYETYMKNN